MRDRRNFIRLLAATGVAVAFDPLQAISQSAQDGLTLARWEPVEPTTINPKKFDRYYGNSQWTNFFQHEMDLGKIMADGSRGLDPDAIRLQNVAQAITAIKEISDPVVQLYAAYEYLSHAFNYDRNNHDKNIEKAERRFVHIQTAEKTFKTGKGQCGDFSSALILLYEQINSGAAKSYIVNGLNFGGLHTVARFQIAGQDLMFDVTNKSVRGTNEFPYSDDFIPCDMFSILGTTGVAAYYDRPSKNIVLQKTDLDFKSLAELPAVKPVKDLGKRYHAIKGSALDLEAKYQVAVAFTPG